MDFMSAPTVPALKAIRPRWRFQITLLKKLRALGNAKMGVLKAREKQKAKQAKKLQAISQNRAVKTRKRLCRFNRQKAWRIYLDHTDHYTPGFVYGPTSTCMGSNFFGGSLEDKNNDTQKTIWLED